MPDKYHHGDLKNALIEAGIRIINESGEQQLSLRKLACACGVSNAAPYAHFKDKEALIAAIQQYVTEKFTDYLSKPLEENSSWTVEQKIISMGKSYTSFFICNPQYFTFLFSRGYIHVNLDWNSNDETNFPPFSMLKKLCTVYFAQKFPDMTEHEKEVELIRIWSCAHGITAVALMDNVTWSQDWLSNLNLLTH